MIRAGRVVQTLLKDLAMMCSSPSSSSVVRQRKCASESAPKISEPSSLSHALGSSKHLRNSVIPLTANTYWLTRILFIRSLSFIYCKFVS